MKHLRATLVLSVVLAMLLTACGKPASSPTPDAGATPPPQSTPIATPDFTPGTGATPDNAATPTPDAQATPEITPTPTATPTPAGPEQSPRPAKVTVAVGSTLNLRAGADTTAEILARLAAGTMVTVLESNTPAGWHKIKTDSGKVGYCAAQYITFIDPAATPTAPATGKTIKQVLQSYGTGDAGVMEGYPQSVTLTQMGAVHITPLTVPADGSIDGVCIRLFLADAAGNIKLELTAKALATALLSIYDVTYRVTDANGDGKSDILLIVQGDDRPGHTTSSCAVFFGSGSGFAATDDGYNTRMAGSFISKPITDPNGLTVGYTQMGFDDMISYIQAHAPTLN
nr:SH3 domain-containing protein [bacterium]